jgi:hypothetical protein
MPGARAEVALFWTATDAGGAYVMRAAGDGSNPVAIVSGAENVLGPNGLEYFEGYLYWPDQQLNAVRRVKPDGSGLGTFAEARNPYDVFMTPGDGFWSSQEEGYVDTRRVGGGGYQRLMTSPTVTRPFALAVTDEAIYCSQVNGSGSIVRAGRTGGNVTTLVPRAFVYDLQVTDKYVYFADNNYPGGIRRVNLDGTGDVTLVPGGALFNGICVTADAIYWSALMDGEGGGIRRCALDGGNPVILYRSPGGTSVRGVVALELESGPARPRLHDVSLTAESIRFLADTEPGKTYHIEGASSLSGWSELTHFTASGTASTIALPRGAGAANQFFRLRVGP